MTDDEPKDAASQTVFNLEAANNRHGYDAVGRCIECMVIGDDLCSIHGDNNKEVNDEVS